MEKISFIGGGNMATSLIGGLLANGTPSSAIAVADPDVQRHAALRKSFGIVAETDNDRVTTGADTVVLAVKPQVLPTVVSGMSDSLRRHAPLVISVAAGVKEPDIRRWSGFDACIVRTMPNTPALVGRGATGLFANPFVTATQRDKAEQVMSSVGLTAWVDQEDLLDAITALSGSGPAYCFLLLELMAKTGTKLGLDPKLAEEFAQQTMLGAATMAGESDVGPAILRERVTSPGGTTERALNIFADGDLESLVEKALTGARDRAVELGQMLGGDD